MNNQHLKKKITQKFWKYLFFTFVCFVFLTATSITLVKLFSPDKSAPSDVLSETANSSVTEYPKSEPYLSEQSLTENSTATPEDSTIEIDMSQIHVNELDSYMPMDRARNYDPQAGVDAVWNEADTIAYYGTNLIPAYIPTGLQPAGENATHPVVLSKENEVWEDTVSLRFDDTKITADHIPQKEFVLTASKLGILHDVLHLGADWEISIIHDVKILIGYYPVSYGSYESPDGYYDYYTVHFKYYDIEYELDFSGIELTEIVKVIASIIYENNQFIISET